MYFLGFTIALCAEKKDSRDSPLPIVGGSGSNFFLGGVKILFWPSPDDIGDEWKLEVREAEALHNLLRPLEHLWPLTVKASRLVSSTKNCSFFKGIDSFYTRIEASRPGCTRDEAYKLTSHL